MSGTSMDGIDASIIVSDGEKELEVIDNYYEKYDRDFKYKLRNFAKNADSLEYLEKNKIIDDRKGKKGRKQENRVAL